MLSFHTYAMLDKLLSVTGVVTASLKNLAVYQTELNLTLLHVWKLVTCSTVVLQCYRWQPIPPYLCTPATDHYQTWCGWLRWRPLVIHYQPYKFRWLSVLGFLGFFFFPLTCIVVWRCVFAGSSLEVKIETDSNDVVVIKTEADSNDITEYLCDNGPSIGMFGLLHIYITWTYYVINVKNLFYNNV